jgi:hypothetical protein
MFTNEIANTALTDDQLDLVSGGLDSSDFIPTPACGFPSHADYSGGNQLLDKVNGKTK